MPSTTLPFAYVTRPARTADSAVRLALFGMTSTFLTAVFVQVIGMA